MQLPDSDSKTELSLSLSLTSDTELFRKHIVASRKEAFCSNEIKDRKVPSSSLSSAARYFMPVISHGDTKPELKRVWLQHFRCEKWGWMWQITVQIDTRVKYYFSVHVKGQIMLGRLLDDSSDGGDGTPCWKINAGSNTGTFYLHASGSAGDYVSKVSSHWSQYGF